jgi:hypothetical protein
MGRKHFNAATSLRRHAAVSPKIFCRFRYGRIQSTARAEKNAV